MSWLDTLAEIRKTDWSKVPDPEREATALEVIQMAGYAAAAASVVPLPVFDIALLLPIHTTMVMTVGHVHGRNLSDAEAKRVAMELGAVAGLTLAGRAALSVLKKVLLPGLGGIIGAPASFAVTYAMGIVANSYFRNPEISREDLKKVFSEAFKEGKSSYREDRQDEFKKDNSAKSATDSASPAPEEDTSSEDNAGSGSGRTKKRSL